jgi:hypothetical protein
VNKKILIVVGILAVLIGTAAVFIFIQGRSSDEDFQKPLEKTGEMTGSDSDAIKAGKILSGGKCEGEGPVKLGALPMDKESFPFLEPYGLMIDSHVTPIDHMYFEPADRQSALDAYNVYAPADGVITEIQRRETGGYVTGVEEEYRLVITYTCTFFSYYDLITVLDPSITDKASEVEKSGFARVEIPVKKGQLIGKIGKQTLDFAVWDTEKPLTGFVVSEHYESEAWKIYTVNPFDYFTDDVRKILIAKNLRTAKPIEGKIDYDIDGKLVGNWFREGTNGYEGANQNKYYEGHLSIVYNYLDPTAIMVSVGDFNGESKQFTVEGNKPDPAKVGKSTGLVKYGLVDFEYIMPNGQPWDRASLVKNLKVRNASQLHGTILFQLVEKRKLKVEIFPGKSASQVSGFTKNVRVYER